MTTEAVARREPAPIAMGENGIKLATLEEAYRFASAVAKSGLAPKGLDTPEKIMIAVQAGMELGFSPMRALSAVVVVNGRPSLYGEAVLALVHDRGVCSRPPVLGVRGTGDDRVGFCRFQRSNMPEAVETTFSVVDAKRAKLWNKAGPWTDYPDDMLQWRALARANKRYFSDVTLGLVSAEEAQDYPAEVAPRSLNPPAEPDPLLSAVSAIDAEVVEEAAPHPEQSEKPPLSLAERAKAAEGFLMRATSSEALEKRWKNTKPLCDELRDPIAQVDPHLYADLKKIYDECAARFAPKGAAPIVPEVISSDDRIARLRTLATTARVAFLKSNDGDTMKANRALAELSEGACNNFDKLSLYLADNPAFERVIEDAIGGGE